MAEYTEHQHRTSDGLALYYREYGADHARTTPLLCLTGLSRNSKDFHALAGRLAAKRRVLCLDYRGCGRSDYDPDYMNYVIEVDCRDVIGLLDALGIRRAIMIGTSRGGLVTMSLAVVRPDLVAAAVLNDVGPEVKDGGRAKVGRYWDLDYAYPGWADATATYSTYMRRVAPDLTDRQWQERARMTFVEAPDGRVHFDFDPNMAKAYRERRSSGHRWNEYEALARKPLLVLRGATSGVLAVETVARMKQMKPNLVTETVPNRGHTPFLDEPVAVAAIDTFLSGAE